MRINTSELIDQALVWAVAQCEGYTATIKPTEVVYVHPNGEWHHNGNWIPSTNWAQGGPIIEREKIDCVADPNGKDVWMGRLYATQLSGEKVIRAYGPTPLIAAMRALVWCKLGDEIDIPEGLSMIPSLQNPQSN